MSTWLCLGKFNALHRGHRALVDAAAAEGRPALVYFRGMAASLGWKRRRPLLDASGRSYVLQQWSEEIGQPIAVIRIAFERIRHMEPGDFLDLLQHEYAIAGLVVGDDFRFGRDRMGDAQHLAFLARKRDLGVQILPPVVEDQQPVSTTRIRAALGAGDMPLAQRLLGRPYQIHGTVIAGDGRGRQLGFPTANCSGITVALPAAGVYACHARLGDGQSRPTAVNIGHLPSISPDRPLSVEAHLLDWQGDCYGQHLELAFAKRLREERRFSSLDALKQQIAADVAAVRSCLG